MLSLQNKCLIIIAFINTISIGSIKADEMDLKKSMKNYGIIPDVIDDAANEIIEISYPSGVSVNLGNELTPTQVKDQPTTVKWNADANSFYTLIMTDPDAPSRSEPTVREFRHWTVVNIPGDDIAKGDTLFEFVGSGPPSGTGLHRYVFLIYKQSNGKLIFDEEKVSNQSAKNRPKFSTRKFIEKYNLGNAIAGNFYEAQYDDYVPILHAQLNL